MLHAPDLRLLGTFCQGLASDAGFVMHLWYDQQLPTPSACLHWTSFLSGHIARRYYICDKKLAALGWTEKTSWEVGLKKTIDWYLEHGFESRWVGDVERALAAHPKAQ